MEALQILFEDRDILVAVKPVGVESESAKGLEPDMVNMIKKHLSNGNGEPYVGVVHRLDKPVSGIMVFAKNKESAAALSRQLREGTMKKKYRAIVCGQPKEKNGKFSDLLLQDNKTNVTAVVKKGTEGGKLAELNYTLLRKKFLEGEQIAEVEIELLTGRHHQIRVQFASHGLPLMGDRKYNPAYTRKDEKGRELPPAGLCGTEMGKQLCLTAVSLAFVHPKSRKALHYEIKPSFTEL